MQAPTPTRQSNVFAGPSGLAPTIPVVGDQGGTRAMAPTIPMDVPFLQERKEAFAKVSSGSKEMSKKH